MFSNNSALVIEFYPFKQIAHGMEWRIKGLVGWIAIRLDTRAYDALTATGSLEGMRTDGEKILFDLNEDRIRFV